MVRRPRGERSVGDAYAPLRDYLSAQTAPELTLSVETIEDMLGFALPRAAQRASWWDTAYAPEEAMPQREACREAGYVAARLPSGSGVRFRRAPRPR